MEASHEFWFDHEKLEVYREAIALIAWLSELLETLTHPNPHLNLNLDLNLNLNLLLIPRQRPRAISPRIPRG
jgi:hypothetical protein